MKELFHIIKMNGALCIENGCRKTDERWIVKDLTGSVLSLIKVPSHYLPVGTVENNVNHVRIDVILTEIRISLHQAAQSTQLRT
jgi:hypothetical protein